jgi:hypothetical protein
MRYVMGVATGLMLVGALAACGGGDEPEEPDGAALVVERYGDCLAELEATDPEVDGAGDVTSMVSGGLLEWEVETSDSGDVLTVPADDFTVSTLASVGC